MLGFKEKNGLSDPPQTIEEEIEESDPNETHQDRSATLRHMSFAPSELKQPEQPLEQFEHDNAIQEIRKMSSIVHRQSIDSGHRTEPANKPQQLTDFTQQMLNFMPVTILQQLCAQCSASENESKIAAIQVPFGFQLHSVVLVAELRNLYDQEHSVDADETSINETLVDVAHQFLEIMTSFLNKYGGDILQFGGNSLVAVWQTPKEHADEKFQLYELHQAFCHKATQCALEAGKDIQKILTGTYELAIGIGFGDFQVLHLGGVLKRIEFFVAGEALQKALYAIRATTKEKPVAVSAEVWKLIEEWFAGEPEPIKDPAAQTKDPLQVQSMLLSKLNASKSQLFKTQMKQAKCYFILKMIHQIKSKRDINLRKNDIVEKKIKLIESQIKSYIPGGFRALGSIKSNNGEQIGQHMQVTVLSMAIDLSQEIFDGRNREGRVVLQAIIEIIQTQVYRLEGSVSKISCYEGGLIMIATWGIQMLSHDDDTQRAVFAAQNIKKQLSSFQTALVEEDDSFDEPPFHAGIASGSVFQGIIGNAQRREIVLIGKTVERSMLLMQSAVKHYSKIYCDYQTKQMASHCIDMDYVEHFELGSKSLNLEVYQPNFSVVVEQKDVFGNNLKATTAQNQSKLIRVHSNPFFLDRDNNYQKNFSEVYGKADVIAKITEDIQAYVRQQTLGEVKQDQIWALAVRGPMGSGKSLFSRRLILETSLREKQILRPLMAQYNSKFCFQYVVSNCNRDVSLKFLGAWRPFLRELLSAYSNSMGQSPEYTLNSQILHGNVDDKVAIVEEIFGLKHLAKTKAQIPLDPTQITSQTPSRTALRSQSALWGGIEAQKFQADYESSIVTFCLNFIVHAVAHLRKICCFFFLIDNASLMNHSSWMLYGLVAQQVDFLITVLNLETRSDYFECTQDSHVSSLNLKILNDSDTTTHYREFIAPFEEDIFNIADMTPISKRQFKQALLDLALVYQRDFEQEIELLTTKKDQKDTQQVRHNREQLKGYYQTNSSFKDIADEVLDAIMELSQGNPLYSFWFTYQAIVKGFLFVRDSTIVPATKFKTCMMLDCWNSLELPAIIFKHNCQLVESKLTIMVNGRRKLDTAEVLQILRLLQNASVIGPMFSSRMLDKIVNRESNVAEINKRLDQIEDCDLIEMVYNEVYNGERFYRFNHHLTQATFYQMQCFGSHRKPVLHQIINFMKENIVFNKTTDWNLEREFALMMRYTMEAQSAFQEEKLDRKSRQVLVIKRLNQRLCKNSRFLRTGFVRVLFKRKGTSATASEFQDMVMVLKQKQIEFYTQKSKRSSDEEAGNVRRTDPPAEEKSLLNWGIKVIRNIQDYQCYRIVNLEDISLIAETEKYVVSTQGIHKAVRDGMLNIFNSKKTESANHKSFVFKMKCDKLSTNDGKPQSQPYTIFVMSQSNKVADINEAENWLTAVEFLRTKLAFESFTASYGTVPFPLPSFGLQHQARSHLQERNVIVPMKTLINEIKACSAYVPPSAQMYGTFNVFNHTSSQQLALPGNQIDYLHRVGTLRTIPSASVLSSLPSQPQLVNGRPLDHRQQGSRKEQVEKLASKLKTLFSVTYLSFLGHMQAATHSSMDPQEELPKPVLGQISHSLRTQFKRQIDDVLDVVNFSAPRLVKNDTQELLRTGRELDQTTDEAFSAFSPTEANNQPSPKMFEPPSQSSTAILDDQKSNLFKEDLRAQVSRVRNKGFVHGQRLCQAFFCKPESSNNFTLLRRYDKVGYNESRKPFIENQKSRAKAQIIKRGLSWRGMDQDEHTRSIQSLQNDFKLPGPTKRKEKGQAIEKILENSHRPWYLTTTQPNVSGLQEEQSSALLEETPHLPAATNSPKAAPSEVFRSTQGAYMSRKRPLTLEGPQLNLEKVPSKQKLSTRQEESKISSKYSIFDLVQGENQSASPTSKSEIAIQNQVSSQTKEDQKEEEASFHDYSHFTNQNLPTESFNAQEQVPQTINAKVSEPQLGTVETVRSQQPQTKSEQTVMKSKQPSVQSQPHPTTQAVRQMPDPLINRGRPAVIIAEQGAPCIVLNAISNQQRSQQKIMLRYNDVVYIDKDLFINGEDKASVLLTKCYLFKEGGVKVDLVIARQFLRVISPEELEQLNLQFAQDEPQDQTANEHLQTEESFSSQKVQRKFVHETSADNLLRQSPTLLNLQTKPENEQLETNRQALQELSKQQQQNSKSPTDGTFSKLQRRRMEKKRAQLQSLQPRPDDLFDFSPVKSVMGGHLVQPVPKPQPKHVAQTQSSYQPTQSVQYPTLVTTELHLSKELSSSCDEHSPIQTAYKGVVSVATSSAVPVALKVNERIKKRRQQLI